MRISDWSSDVCSSDLQFGFAPIRQPPVELVPALLHREHRMGREIRFLELFDVSVPIGRCRCCRLGDAAGRCRCDRRSEEHTSELQSLMLISYAVFCLKKKKQHVHIALKDTSDSSTHVYSNYT